MAEAALGADRDLGRFLTCTLCRRHFNNPKILPCMHTFCKGCLQNVVEQERTSGETLSCPECQTSASLRSVGVESLQNNEFVASLIDSSLEGLSTKYCQICAIDGESSEATCICLDCSDYLCDGCRNSHGKTRQTRDHKVVSLDDPMMLCQRKPQGTLPCRQHPTEILRYFCVTCEQLICLTCLVDQHKHHDSMSLEQATERCKTQLLSLFNYMTEKKITLDRRSQGVKKHIQDSEQMQTTIKETLEVKSKSICLAIQQVMQNAISKMESTSGRIIEEHKLEREVMESISRQMADCKTTLDLVSSNASDLQLLDTYSLSMRRCRELGKMATDKSDQVFEDLNTASFQDETIEKFLKECSKQILPVLENKDVPENATLLRKLNSPYSKHVTSLGADEKQSIFACVEGKVFVCKNFGGWTSLKLSDAENERTISKLVYDKDVLICTEGDDPGNASHLSHYIESSGETKLFSLDTAICHTSLTVCQEGTILLTDESNGWVYQMSKEGHILKKFGKGVLHRPCSAVQNVYQQIVVADIETNEVFVFNKSGTLLRSLKDGMRKNRLSSPAAVALDKHSYIYVLCKESKQVLLFSRHGEFMCCLLRFGDNFNRLDHMTISSNDKLFIAAEDSILVYKLNRRNGMMCRV